MANSFLESLLKTLSDHRLITVKLSLRRRPPTASPLSFRRIDEINVKDFQVALSQSALFTNPATTANSFAQQLADVVAETLDDFAPLETFNHRPSKPITKWLSPQAVTAKRQRRKLERKWLANGSDTDRADYRQACRA